MNTRRVKNRFSIDWSQKLVSVKLHEFLETKLINIMPKLLFNLSLKIYKRKKKKKKNGFFMDSVKTRNSL